MLWIYAGSLLLYAHFLRRRRRSSPRKSAAVTHAVSSQSGAEIVVARPSFSRVKSELQWGAFVAFLWLYTTAASEIKVLCHTAVRQCVAVW